MSGYKNDVMHLSGSRRSIYKGHTPKPSFLFAFSYMIRVCLKLKLNASTAYKKFTFVLFYLYSECGYKTIAMIADFKNFGFLRHLLEVDSSEKLMFRLKQM